MRCAVIIELRVSFEVNFAQAQLRKLSMYHDLMEEVVQNGFDIDFMTLEVGFVCIEGFQQLKDIFM